MTKLSEQLAALKPVQCIEELTPAAQDALQSAYIETSKRKADCDAYDVAAYLTPLYLDDAAPADVKEAQFDALHFLHCLQDALHECATETYYKRDESSRWWQCDFSELARSAGWDNWEGKATYLSIFGAHEAYERLEDSVFQVVASVLDDYDRAGVFVTQQKPEDFDE